MSFQKRAAVEMTREEWLPCEEAIHKFEDAWHQGSRPAIEDYLPESAGPRWTALIELVHTEMEHRLTAGEAVRVEEYLQRYPELAADPDVALDLVAAEYRLRRREPDLSQADYLARFPQLALELSAEWETRFERPAAAAADQTSLTSSVAPAQDDTATEVDLSAEQSRLGKYELLEVVGAGSFGVVYRARDTELERTVAVKIPRRRMPVRSEEKDRFLREARSVAQLQHAHIVALHDVQQSNGSYCLVYEFIEGRTLAEQMAGQGLDLRQAALLLAEIAEALDYAHRQGVVHRDLKPSNILLDPAGRPHLTDFGLAKRETAESQLTIEGQVLGTPAYMSPEQARGEASKVDARSDVYSLGAVFYELLTGETPFRGHPRMVLTQVLEDDPHPPRRLNDRVPRDLETICLKCLQKDPNKRYGSALDLAGDLRHFLAGEPIEARPVRAWEHAWKWARRRPAWAALIAVSIFAAATLVIGGLSYAQHERRHALEAQDLALDARRNQYTAEVNLAYEAWDRSRKKQARELLERQRPLAGQQDLRDFAWYYLWGLCEHDLVLRQHAGAVICLALSPDGKTFVSGSQDRTVKVWDVANWAERATLRGHTKKVYGAAFTPDGGTLATGSWDDTIRIWDLRLDRERAIIPTPAGAVYCLAFSPDGKTLAYGAGNEGLVRLWDVPQGREREVLQARIEKPFTGSRLVECLAFSPDGKELAVGYWADFSVRIWNLAARRVRTTLAGYTSNPFCVAYSPDGTVLATGGGTATLRLSDAATGKELRALVGHTAEIASIAFAPDGQTVATASRDGSVRLWNPATGQPQAVLMGHTGSVNSVVFTPGGRTLITAGGDHTIRVWDAVQAQAQIARQVPDLIRSDVSENVWTGRSAIGQGPVPLAGQRGPVNALAMSADGKRVAAAGDAIRVWDLTTGAELVTISEQARCGVALLPDGDTVVSVDPGGVQFWDCATGQKVAVLPGKHKTGVYGIDVSADRQTIASCGGEPGVQGEVLLWDIGTRQLRCPCQGHTDWVRAVVFSPDGKTLATGSGDETIKLWDAATGQEKATLQANHDVVYALAFDADGQSLAAGNGDGSVQIWDMHTHQVRALLQGHIGAVHAVAFTRDGKTLATGSRDCTIKLWDVATGRELATLTGHTSWIDGLAFTPDGKTLISGARDGKVLLWQAAPDGA